MKPQVVIIRAKGTPWRPRTKQSCAKWKPSAKPSNSAWSGECAAAHARIAGIVCQYPRPARTRKRHLAGAGCAGLRKSRTLVMEWVEGLHGSVVAVDTAPLIYFIEENPRYLPHLRAFFGAADKGRFRAATSILTLIEVLIHPLRRGNFRLADEYRRILLHADNVEAIPVSAAIAEEAAAQSAIALCR